MSRPLVLVFFFLLVAFTSQFERKQRIVNGVEASPRIPQMHRQSKRKNPSRKSTLCLHLSNIPSLNSVLHVSLDNVKMVLNIFDGRLVVIVGLLQIILSQEKSIRKLADLVRSLREQLLQCKHKFKDVNNTAVPLTELLNELDQQQQILDV
ncbi:hypothetical protein C3L33_02467, partial [Rhododendron williamsianum]